MSWWLRSGCLLSRAGGGNVASSSIIGASSGGERQACSASITVARTATMRPLPQASAHIVAVSLRQHQHPFSRTRRMDLASHRSRQEEGLFSKCSRHTATTRKICTSCSSVRHQDEETSPCLYRHRSRVTHVSMLGGSAATAAARSIPSPHATYRRSLSSSSSLTSQTPPTAAVTSSDHDPHNEPPLELSAEDRQLISSSSSSSEPPLILSSTSHDPYFNLSYEDYLFRHVPPNERPILFMYRNKGAVVIGRNQVPWKEVDPRRLKEEGVALVRRRSGGGAVYHVSLGREFIGSMSARTSAVKR